MDTRYSLHFENSQKNILQFSPEKKSCWGKPNYFLLTPDSQGLHPTCQGSTIKVIGSVYPGVCNLYLGTSLTKIIKIIENVQKKGQYMYTITVKHIIWKTLEQRRRQNHLIIMHMIHIESTLRDCWSQKTRAPVGQQLPDRHNRPEIGQRRHFPKN